MNLDFINYFIRSCAPLATREHVAFDYMQYVIKSEDIGDYGSLACDILVKEEWDGLSGAFIYEVFINKPRIKLFDLTHYGEESLFEGCK